MDWTDESRADVIEKYKDKEPTPENSMDIVKQLAEDLGDGVTANGIRSILSKAGVYIKKVPAATGGGATGDKPKSTRVNKADQQKALTDLIESMGKEADQDIITKLTGKAAQYLVEVFTAE